MPSFETVGKFIALLCNHYQETKAHGNFYLYMGEIYKHLSSFKVHRMSMYLHICTVLRHMEISMYLYICTAQRYMEISMYLYICTALRYMEISMYLHICTAL